MYLSSNAHLHMDVHIRAMQGAIAGGCAGSGVDGHHQPWFGRPKPSPAGVNAFDYVEQKSFLFDKIKCFDPLA